MINSILDVSNDNRHLSIFRGFVVITDSDTKNELGRIPIDDLNSVILHAHGLTMSANFAVQLAERGIPLVICGSNHAPAAYAIPIDGNRLQSRRMRSQWDCPRPVYKQIWKSIIISKIMWQSHVLDSFEIDNNLKILCKKVESDDKGNIEGYAASIYWKLLMGNDFKRDRNLEGVNSMLNYGYTVLRAAVSRSVIASGLHPTIGIHHKNQYNSFALSDDLVEPFRPLVDALTYSLLHSGENSVTGNVKKAYAKLLNIDIFSNGEKITVGNAILRLSQSVENCFTNSSSELLILPELKDNFSLKKIGELCR